MAHNRIDTLKTIIERIHDHGIPIIVTQSCDSPNSKHVHMTQEVLGQVIGSTFVVEEQEGETDTGKLLECLEDPQCAVHSLTIKAPGVRAEDLPGEANQGKLETTRNVARGIRLAMQLNTTEYILVAEDDTDLGSDAVASLLVARDRTMRGTWSRWGSSSSSSPSSARERVRLATTQALLRPGLLFDMEDWADSSYRGPVAASAFEWDWVNGRKGQASRHVAPFVSNGIKDEVFHALPSGASGLTILDGQDIAFSTAAGDDDGGSTSSVQRTAAGDGLVPQEVERRSSSQQGWRGRKQTTEMDAVPVAARMDVRRSTSRTIIRTFLWICDRGFAEELVSVLDRQVTSIGSKIEAERGLAGLEQECAWCDPLCFDHTVEAVLFGHLFASPAISRAASPVNVGLSGPVRGSDRRRRPFLGHPVSANEWRISYDEGPPAQRASAWRYGWAQSAKDPLPRPNAIKPAGPWMTTIAQAAARTPGSVGAFVTVHPVIPLLLAHPVAIMAGMLVLALLTAVPLALLAFR